jgi:hypothetical protein
MALEIHTEGLDGWCDPSTGVCHFGPNLPAPASLNGTDDSSENAETVDVAEAGNSPRSNPTLGGAS